MYDLFAKSSTTSNFTFAGTRPRKWAVCLSVACAIPDTVGELLQYLPKPNKFILIPVAESMKSPWFSVDY